MDQYVRINPYFDIIELEERLLLLDHFTPRHIKLKAHPVLVSLLKCLKEPGPRELLLERVQQDMRGDFDAVIYEAALRQLTSLNAVDFYDTSKGRISDSEENRFRDQIDWLSSFETENLSRYEIFRKIRKSTIALVGIGGAGSNVAALAAAAGIGKLILIDQDIVEESNLVRQIFYKQKQAGKNRKTDALEKYIKDFSSFTEVKKISRFVRTAEEVEKAIDGADVVVQTADTPTVLINRYINQVCIKKRVPYIYAFNGSVGPFYVPGKSACFFCLEDFVNKESKGMHEFIVKALSPLPSRRFPCFVSGPWVQAHYLFMEVFHHLAGTKDIVLKDRMLTFKPSYQIQLIEIPRKKGCACGRVYAAQKS